MNNFKFLWLLLLLMFLNSHQLFAIIYENAEDTKSTRWQLLDASSLGTVENIYDEQKKSRVIRLKGEETKSAYQLIINKSLIGENQGEKILHWEMNYSEDFVIIVGMDTAGGKRYLIYTPSGEDAYMQYGLGENACSGVWQRYARDLQEDLNQFEEFNEIKRVNTFVIRGSGRMDNVAMLKKPFTDKQESLEPLPTPKKNISNSVPSIQIDGENPVYLKIGKEFVDSGAKAYDKEDGELVVISSHDIDISKAGRYSVMYIATDSMGNTAIDTRYIEVGEVDEIEEASSVQSVLKEQQIAMEKEHYEEALKLEERELEISAWEKELELREKEISKREYQMQKIYQFQNEEL